MHLRNDLTELWKAYMVRVVIFLGSVGVGHVDLLGLDDAIGLGLQFLAEALLGDVEEAIALGIDALDEFCEVLGPAITTGERAQCKGWGRHGEVASTSSGWSGRFSIEVYR